MPDEYMSAGTAVRDGGGPVLSELAARLWGEPLRVPPPLPDLLAESDERAAHAAAVASSEYGRFAPVTAPELPATLRLPDPYGPDRIVFGSVPRVRGS